MFYFCENREKKIRRLDERAVHTVESVCRGSVSPTVRDRGKCSWPNAHSPAPPSPTQHAHKVKWEVRVTHTLQSGELRHTYTQAEVWSHHRQNAPGSWRSSTTYPLQRPPVGGGPAEPQLSTLLSSERNTGLRKLPTFFKRHNLKSNFNF